MSDNLQPAFPEKSSGELKPCLVVVFNHRFDANLPKLRALYKGRFTHVHYLMPFYEGSDPDVTAIYESSARFQGYFAQGRAYYKKEDVSHYVFVADDLLLDPTLNESNLLQTFQLGKNDAYIKELIPLSEETFNWPFLYMTLKACRFDNFVNARVELPSRDEALRCFEARGLSTARLGWRNLPRIENQKMAWSVRSWILCSLLLFAEKGGVRNIVYPMARAYADLVIVPTQTLSTFCHYCGVFAGMGVFVEAAIPTALILAAETIRLEKDLGRRGVEMLHLHERDAFEEKNGRRLAGLLEGSLPDDVLYIHPVKLSRWSTEA